MIPDKIYSVIILDDSTPGNTRGAWSCVEVEGALNTEYIRKDALMEWLNRMLELSAQSFEFQRNYAYGKVIDKLNSM